MGLQTVPSDSQHTENKALTTSAESSVQTSAQTKAKNGLKQAHQLHPDLVEVVTAWPELLEHIRAAIALR